MPIGYIIMTRQASKFASASHIWDLNEGEPIDMSDPKASLTSAAVAWAKGEGLWRELEPDVCLEITGGYGGIGTPCLREFGAAVMQACDEFDLDYPLWCDPQGKLQAEAAEQIAGQRAVENSHTPRHA